MQDQRQPTPEQQFAERCRRLRESYGWPQTELAGRLVQYGIKLDGSAITRLERGARNIRLNEAVAIATELGFLGVDPMVRPAMTPEEQLEWARAEEREAGWRAMTANAEHAAKQAQLDRLERQARGEVVEQPPTSWSEGDMAR